MLIFLNKYIGNFEKWIKFIEFSLKTAESLTHNSLFIMLWNIYLNFILDINILRLRNRVNTIQK